MKAWLRRAAAAVSLASGRSDLWPAASLAWLAYLGWLPLLLAVAPPQVPDIAQLAVQLGSASSFPWNVVALCGAVVTGFLLLCLLAALGEVALVRRLVSTAARSPDDALGSPTLMSLAVILLASTPVLIALAWLAISVAEVAPAVYGEPGSAATVPTRLAARVIPQLVAVAAAILAAQAIGGLALRHALLRPGASPGAAILAGSQRIGRRPAPWLGLAAVGWLKDALVLVLSWGLLQLLWRPIGEALGPGLLTRPQVLALLVGFVAIWLSLLLVGGALHVFISAWWLAEWRSTEDG